VNAPSPPPRESDVKVLGELLREAAGFERGLVRTFVDLKKNPRLVLEGYLAQDYKYVGPFRLLITSLSLWILINSFLIDWYAIWKILTEGILNAEVRMIAWLSNLDAAGEKKLNDNLLAFDLAGKMSKAAGDFFSKWFVPFALITVVGGSLYYSRRHKADLRHTMYVMSYAIGASIPLYLVLSFVFLVSPELGVVFSIVVVVVDMLGFSQFTTIAPIRGFYEMDGKATEKKIMTSILIVIFATLVTAAAGIAIGHSIQ